MLDRMPPIVSALLWSNGLMFLLQSLLGDERFLAFMLWPLGQHALGYSGGEMVTAEFFPWQLLTYGFLHGGVTHLFFNMLALLMFGAPLEATWGSRRFAIYYFTCIAGAGLVQLVVATSAAQGAGGAYPTVGASGGVFGLLLAYGMLFPNHRVMLLIPPIPMKAWMLVVGYGALELVLGVTGTRPGVAHFAHLGGMAFGFFLIQYWRGRWPFRRPPRPRI
jgi:membrane associated rhomboid family serine protease